MAVHCHIFSCYDIPEVIYVFSSFKTVSRIPDPDFRCFYISYIPIPACWKDKKLTAARRSYAGRTSFSGVIVMLKLRHHVATQRIQDFPEVNFMFFQYKLVSKKTNPFFV